MNEILSRAAHLAALVFAPKLLSPDPAHADGGGAFFAVLFFLVTIGLGVWLVRRFENIQAKAALGLWILTNLALLYQAHATLKASEPLLRGFYMAAPLAWFALGATLATLAGEYLGTSFKNKRSAAFVAAVAIGMFIFRDANDLISSPVEQWRAALAAEPTHERALMALADEVAKAPAGEAKLEACIGKQPDSCVCRTLRAERRLDADHRDEALKEASQARCDGHPMAARLDSVRAVAFALSGQNEEADAIIANRLPAHPNDAKLLYAQALTHNVARAPDTLDLAQRAANLGAGRGAELLVVALLLEKDDRALAHDATKKFLEKHPEDADGLYNAALLWDRENDYNKAREGYMKALKVKPSFADARYNLALLTFRFGAKDEAKVHATKFMQMAPNDPRRLSLAKQVGL